MSVCESFGHTCGEALVISGLRVRAGNQQERE
jgi:hypothetical protein